MKNETKSLIDELIVRPHSAFLATIDENNNPSIRAIFNLRCKERFSHPAKIIEEYDDNPYTVYISTNTSSIKMKHIIENNNVAIYFSLPDESKGMMLQGKAEILDDIEFKKKIWEESWTMYYPEGYTDPDFTILKFMPIVMRGWYRGQHAYNFEA